MEGKKNGVYFSNDVVVVFVTIKEILSNYCHGKKMEYASKRGTVLDIFSENIIATNLQDRRLPICIQVVNVLRNMES